MKVGIVGLPNVGKSSLFNLLTSAQAKVDLYPFTTIDKNIGVVSVPDERLKKIGELLKPAKLTPATIEFVDIAGLVKGASEGEGLGNKFLSFIREVDIIVHLLRTFVSETIPHIYGDIDPARDKEIVESELAISDLVILERQIPKLKKEKGMEKRWELLERIKLDLEKGQFPIALNPMEKEMIKEYNLFSVKDFIYVINHSEDAFDLAQYPKLRGEFYPISCSLEEEMKDWSEEEKREMRRSLGLREEGIWGIVEMTFNKLGLIRFYTIKGEETRAWSIPKGTKVIEAAGKIHSDFALGFIKAEVLSYNDLLEWKDFHKAREMGKTRIEGKDYIVQDGDIILIHFRV